MGPWPSSVRGPAGLSVARMFRKYGVDYDQFERHSGVGGLWDIDNPGTPMYESAHFISSGICPVSTTIRCRRRSPTTRPADRSSHTRQFADDFGLFDAIRLGNGVTRVDADGDKWLVTTSDGTTARYHGVVCASGTNWHPRIPVHRATSTARSGTP